MTTFLEKPLRREIEIDSKPYTLTITGAGFTLVEKRRRRGVELKWRDVVNGDAQLAAALHAGAPPPDYQRRRSHDERQPNENKVPA